MSQVSNEIDKILLKIFKIKRIEEYQEYPLQQYVSVNTDMMKKILLDLNSKPNIEAYYNNITKKCDSIGVIDIKENRIIDFNDTYFDLENKGIDCMVL